MSNITQAQRDAYRYALEDKGVPEVIAFMAAKNYTGIRAFNCHRTAIDMIGAGFWWTLTAEGETFWRAVYADAKETCK